MSVSTKYKKLSCYQKMEESHRDCFDKFAQVYGEQLNNSIHIGDSLFTLHDFNHHCYDLYDIISNYLCYISIAEDGSRGLTEHELFLLNIAVLFHDYSMNTTTNLDINRKSHSKDSAKLLLDEWKNFSSTLYVEGQKVDLSNNDIKAIAQIIESHSGAFPENLGKMPSSSGNVRAVLLAGILRIADELDITSNRLGNEKLASQLDSSIPDSSESKKHWRKLHVFSHLAIDSSIPDQLNLVVDDDVINSEIQNGNEDNVLDEVAGVFQKVKDEWEKIYNKYLRKIPDIHSIIRITDIELDSKLEFVREFINKDSFIVSNAQSLYDNEAKSTDDNPPKTGTCLPIVISETTKEHLDNFIKTQKLHTPGHYLMTDQYCARDWIDTHELLKGNAILDECIQALTLNIRDNFNLENTVILGIDFNGTLVGARVAALLQRPFAFLIPSQRQKSSSMLDNQIELSKYTHAIMVTDVIATASTENDIISSHSLKDKIEAIYTLLYRSPRLNGKAIERRDQYPIYCISDSFSIEIAEKTSCEWNGSADCMALNKIIK